MLLPIKELSEQVEMLEEDEGSQRDEILKRYEMSQKGKILSVDEMSEQQSSKELESGEQYCSSGDYSDDSDETSNLVNH